jgi:GSH-dependent disulfide-bond oxidoreductase
VINLYYWPTPNGHKITMFLEETQLAYQLVPVNIKTGQQFTPEFLAISPNNRMPAIVDTEPTDGGGPISIFESGAILLYLAEKTGQLLPRDLRGQQSVRQWLFWQVAGLGPMAGQNHHFGSYALEQLPYAVDRYVNETNRLYGVLDRRLTQAPYLGGTDYSIADIATYPWIVPWQRQRQDLNDFSALKRWFEGIAVRPATIRAYARAREVSTGPVVTEESRKILFGQTSGITRSKP